VLDSVGPLRRPDGLVGGHVFNLGHGINQHTPVASVDALVDEVRRYSPRYHT
jgi:uroporphyrinogen decarboxylase